MNARMQKCQMSSIVSNNLAKLLVSALLLFLTLYLTTYGSQIMKLDEYVRDGHGGRRCPFIAGGPLSFGKTLISGEISWLFFKF